MAKENAREASTAAQSGTGSSLPNSLRDWAKSPPRNLDEAREMPLEPRCKLVLARPDLRGWVQPDQWPEVRLAASAFREAVKKPRMALGTYDTDAGVKRLVELYAAGLTAEEVCGAIPGIVASEWFRGGSPKDLGSLTLTVVRRALGEAANPIASDSPRCRGRCSEAEREPR